MRRRRREEGQSLWEKISNASSIENKEGITALSRVVFGVLRANLFAGGNSFAPIGWPEVVQRGPFVGGQFGAYRKGGEDISNASFNQRKTGITVRAEYFSERADAGRRQCEVGWEMSLSRSTSIKQ